VGNGQCLEDQPDASLQLPDPTDLPGFTFDADAQCRARHGPTAEVCPFGMDVSHFIKLYWTVHDYYGIFITYSNCVMVCYAAYQVMEIALVLEFLLFQEQLVALIWLVNKPLMCFNCK